MQKKISTQKLESNDIISYSFELTPDHEEKGAKINTEGRWTFEEKLRFVFYLDDHKDSFRDSTARRKGRVFCQAANHLKTRKSNQIRSHFQKMFTKYKSVQRIVSHYKQKMSENTYEARKKKEFDSNSEEEIHQNPKVREIGIQVDVGNFYEQKNYMRPYWEHYLYNEYAPILPFNGYYGHF